MTATAGASWTFAVWAPRARRVEVVVDGRRWSMTGPDGMGWYRAEVAGAGPGTDYAYSLDGGPARPDPRSRSQPRGVHGPSRVWVPPAARPPRPGRPLDGTSLIYELHVGTFSASGTFDGVVAHLDHLVDLGVSHLELMPVAAFDGDRGWSYDGVDLWAVHHAYGGADGLGRLVDACHERGLGVLLDVVYNHLGPSGNYLAEFGPYFTDRYTTPWGAAVNYDGPGSDEVRRFVVDNALAWLADHDLDGLRLDAVHAIYDASALHVLEELARAVEDLSARRGRPLALVAESDLNDPRVVGGWARGGYGVGAQWVDDLHHALHALLTGERTGYYGDFGTLEHLAKALRQGYVYDGQRSAYRQRRHGRRPEGIPASRFVTYAQTHDQVGNRALGERLVHLVGPARARVAAAVALLAPSIPMVFQGEEWAASSPFRYFSDHRDPDLARAVSEGRTQEFAAFGWEPAEVPDPQDPATFAASVLDWAEVAGPDHAAMLDWYRHLVALRRSRPELNGGSYEGVEATVSGGGDGGGDILRLRRAGLTVTVNLGREAVALPGAVLAASPPTVGGRLAPDGVAVTEDG